MLLVEKSMLQIIVASALEELKVFFNIYKELKKTTKRGNKTIHSSFFYFFFVFNVKIK